MIVAVYSNDCYDLEVVNEQGFLFLHIHLSGWGPGVVKSLKEDVEYLVNSPLVEGHDVVFALTEDKKITKLWNLIRPCFELRQLEDDSWFGAWLVKEI